MRIDDILIAKEEAKKFLHYVNEFLKTDKEHDWESPAERGLIRAQSLILSRALSAMRNPYSCPRSAVSKRIRNQKKGEKEWNGLL